MTPATSNPSAPAPSITVEVVIDGGKAHKIPAEYAVTDEKLRAVLASVSPKPLADATIDRPKNGTDPIRIITRSGPKG